jgi:enoyl-[acyl-carrier protein] reductase / trans-2-enoyl-CoA reductase (NAD+)
MTTTTDNESIVIQPRVRGFICVTAHPKGCAAHVQEQINYVKKQGPIEKSPKNVLVIGASTGYGLASRITAAFAGKANSLGVFFEKLPSSGKPATAGWYNSEAVAKFAQAEGLYAGNINGDAFSNEIKQKAVEEIKKNMGKVDLVVYSLASPVRTHPDNGVVYRSVLKPIGQTFSAKTLDTDKELVKDVTIEPATEQEVADTVVVMGGEDWQMWMDALRQADVLADNAVSVAYSYIGPEVTWSVYKDGAIGKAKEDLEKTAKNITSVMNDKGVKAYVSVNKAVVTQASSAIPVVPLYISLLFKVMKEKNVHEDCIEQIHRLFSEQLFNGKTPKLDEAGRIRLDDREMNQDVQAAVQKLWQQVTSENLKQISDFAGYKANFLKLFGFGLPGVNYEEAVDPTKV